MPLTLTPFIPGSLNSVGVTCSESLPCSSTLACGESGPTATRVPGVLSVAARANGVLTLTPR